MDLSRVAYRLGSILILACVIFGLSILLMIRTFTAGIVPSSDGREVPDAVNIVLAFVSMFLLIAIAPAILSKMSTSLKERLRRRGSWLWELLLLILSSGALVRAFLGAGPALSGELALMSLVAEVWFGLVGVLGVALWVVLQGCRHQLRRHDLGFDLPWDSTRDEPMSYAEFARRRWGKDKS